MIKPDFIIGISTYIITERKFLLNILAESSISGLICKRTALELPKATGKAKIIQAIINNNFVAKIIGDGLIISTPMGSSGYNYSSGGSILPLNSNFSLSICLFIIFSL